MMMIGTRKTMLRAALAAGCLLIGAGRAPAQIPYPYGYPYRGWGYGYGTWGGFAVPTGPGDFAPFGTAYGSLWAPGGWSPYDMALTKLQNYSLNAAQYNYLNAQSAL